MVGDGLAEVDFFNARRAVFVCWRGISRFMSLLFSLFSLSISALLNHFPFLLRQCVLVLLLWCAAMPSAHADAHLSAATVCMQFDGEPDCVPREVTLPFYWDTLARERSGWARIVLHAPAESFWSASAKSSIQPQPPIPALLLGQVGNSFSVQLNGEQVYSTDTLGDWRVDTVKTPWLIQLPHRLLKEDNELVITLHAQYGRAAQLSVVQVGTTSSLHADFIKQRFWRDQLSMMLGWMSIVLGLMALMVWWSNREPAFIAYAIAELGWGFRMLDLTWVETPLHWHDWGIVVGSVFAMSQMAMSYFFVSLVGAWPRWVKVLFALMGAMWVAILVSLHGHVSRDIWMWWAAARSVANLVLVGYIFWMAYQQKQDWRWLFVLVVLSSLILDVVDVRGSPRLCLHLS
jgi:hypothetical protein